MNRGSASVLNRFWTKITPAMNGCWEWQGYRLRGYGRFYICGVNTTIGAHRFAYEVSTSIAIPAGLTIDHLCKNPSCCNPAHLEPVTARENSLRGNGIPARNAVKTHCKYGHEFTEANTVIVARGRECRICKTALNKKHAKLSWQRVLAARRSPTSDP